MPTDRKKYARLRSLASQVRKDLQPPLSEEFVPRVGLANPPNYPLDMPVFCVLAYVKMPIIKRRSL